MNNLQHPLLNVNRPYDSELQLSRVKAMCVVNRVQSICLLFISWKSDHFWLRYSKFHIWPWKFKVKVMAKVKPDGHIWGLKFNWYSCFLFCENRTIFGWDIASSIFDLENSRSRSWPRSNPMVTFRPRFQLLCLLFVSWQSEPFLAEI